MSAGGRPLFGYRFDAAKDKYVVVPNEAIIIKHMYMYVCLGYTAHQTAQILNALGSRTRKGKKLTTEWVTRHLTRSAYAGKSQSSLFVADIREYDAIVSQAVFKEASYLISQSINDQRAKQPHTKLCYVYKDPIDQKRKPKIVMDGDLRNFIVLVRGEIIT